MVTKTKINLSRMKESSYCKGDTFYEGMGDDEQKELAVKFHEKIISQQDVFSEIHLSTSPYVAFVKFKHIPSDLNCDISFRSGMSTTNSKLVKTYLQIDPRVKYVICGVKYWMEKTELKIGFLSIAQTWLALFFLIQKGIVPSVDKLRSMMPINEQTLIINGWNCAFPNIDDIEWSSPCTLSEEELLREFFIFYGDNGLSLQNYVLSPSSGKKIDKTHFISQWKNKTSFDEFIRIMRDFRGPMGIHDPFVHYKTLTRFNQYWERTFLKFVEYCKETVRMYSHIPESNPSWSRWKLRSKTLPNEYKV